MVMIAVAMCVVMMMVVMVFTDGGGVFVVFKSSRQARRGGPFCRSNVEKLGRTARRSMLTTLIDRGRERVVVDVVVVEEVKWREESEREREKVVEGEKV